MPGAQEIQDLAMGKGKGRADWLGRQRSRKESRSPWPIPRVSVVGQYASLV